MIRVFFANDINEKKYRSAILSGKKTREIGGKEEESTKKMNPSPENRPLAPFYLLFCARSLLTTDNPNAKQACPEPV